MDDEADLKKIVDVLKISLQDDKAEDLQIQEFINLDESEDEEENEEYEQLPSNFNFFEKPIEFDITTLYKYNPKYSLKPDEKALIESCRDPQLKKLLILNRQKNMQLIQLYKKYKDLLIECKQNLVDKNEIIRQYYAAHKVHSQSSGSWRVGAPYFKDKDFYLAPQNPDAARKKANNELSYYDLMPLKKWTGYECDRLLKAVKLNYNLNLITETKKEIRRISASDLEDKEEQVHALELRLNELNDEEITTVPPLGADDKVNWIRVAEIFVKDKHSDFECRSFWNMYLHPDINKSKWKAPEKKQLVSLVQKHKLQNWDQIAKELGTNRSCFGVCVHYFQNFYNSFKKGEFTYNEDRKLLELIHKYKMGSFIPWVRIVRHFKNRTRAQLYHRFTYYLNEIDKKRGKFTEAEDVLIMLCVKQFGRDFKKCGLHLPDRSVTQIKSRYYCGLEGYTKKGTWTIEEDQFVINFVKEKGQQWTLLSKQMCRSSGQIRQRYHIVQNYLAQGYNLHNVPRRKHYNKREFEEFPFPFLSQIVDKLSQQSVIPSLKEVEDTLAQIRTVSSKKLEMPIDIDPDEPLEQKTVAEDIDEQLTNFFCNNSDPDVSKVQPSNLSKTVDDVEALLHMLKADLVVPKNLPGKSKLDALDRKILAELNRRKSLEVAVDRRSGDIEGLVPPNFFTTTGVRDFIIRNFKFKGIPNFRIFGNVDLPVAVKKKVKNELNQQKFEVNTEDQTQVEVERALFFRRFVSIFKWPAVLTLEEPTRELVSVSNSFNFDLRPQVRRTFSKKRPNGEATSADEATNKVRILDGDAKQCLQLKPVTNKSVIENLMKDASKKLYCFNDVKCGNRTKTVVKEVDLNFLPGRSDDRNNSEEVPAALDKVVPKDRNNVLKQEAVPEHHNTFLEEEEEEDAEDIDDDLEVEEGNYKTSRRYDLFEDESGDGSQMGCTTSLDKAAYRYELEDNDMLDLQKLDSFIKTEKRFE